MPARRWPSILRASTFAVCCSFALMLSMQQCAAGIVERRREAIEQPWPCRYDRGVLATCRPAP